MRSSKCWARSPWKTTKPRTGFGAAVARMDDVLDYLETAVERLWLYDLPQPTPESKDLARVLVTSCEEVKKALDGLRNVKARNRIQQICVDINRLENEADSLSRVAVAKLFKSGGDALHVMKWKEIYE